MKKLPLSEEILAVILCVQSAKSQYINESILDQINPTIWEGGQNKPKDWLARTREYYFDCLDTEKIKNLGLVKNEYCFDAIIQFNATDEILKTEKHELGKFSFVY